MGVEENTQEAIILIMVIKIVPLGICFYCGDAVPMGLKKDGFAVMTVGAVGKKQKDKEKHGY
jgi:hypothetical protein